MLIEALSLKLFVELNDSSESKELNSTIFNLIILKYFSNSRGVLQTILSRIFKICS